MKDDCIGPYFRPRDIGENESMNHLRFKSERIADLRRGQTGGTESQGILSAMADDDRTTRKVWTNGTSAGGKDERAQPISATGHSLNQQGVDEWVHGKGCGRSPQTSSRRESKRTATRE